MTNHLSLDQVILGAICAHLPTLERVRFEAVNSRLAAPSPPPLYDKGRKLQLKFDIYGSHINGVKLVDRSVKDNATEVDVWTTENELYYCTPSMANFFHRIRHFRSVQFSATVDEYGEGYQRDKTERTAKRIFDDVFTQLKALTIKKLVVGSDLNDVASHFLTFCSPEALRNVAIEQLSFVQTGACGGSHSLLLQVAKCTKLHSFSCRNLAGSTEISARLPGYLSECLRQMTVLRRLTLDYQPVWANGSTGTSHPWPSSNWIWDTFADHHHSLCDLRLLYHLWLPLLTESSAAAFVGQLRRLDIGSLTHITNVAIWHPDVLVCLETVLAGLDERTEFSGTFDSLKLEELDNDEDYIYDFEDDSMLILLRMSDETRRTIIARIPADIQPVWTDFLRKFLELPSASAVTYKQEEGVLLGGHGRITLKIVP